MEPHGKTPEPETEGRSLKEHLHGIVAMADTFLANTFHLCSADEVMTLMVSHGRNIRSALPQMESLPNARVLRSYLMTVHMRIEDVMHACAIGLHSSEPRTYLEEAWDNMQLIPGLLEDALKRGEANALSTPFMRGSYPWDADLVHDFVSTVELAKQSVTRGRRERSLATTRLQLKASYGRVIAPALFAPHKAGYAALEANLAAGIRG